MTFTYMTGISRRMHSPLHGFRHPATALRNARKHFALNKVEENVIISHMWPLTAAKSA